MCQLEIAGGDVVPAGDHMLWTPTRTFHDPNPPIVLETPEAPPPAAGGKLRRLIMCGGR